MALGPRLDLRQSQSLVMTPQLQQAVRLLALSNLELAGAIAEELDRNPLLDGSSGGDEDGGDDAGDARFSDDSGDRSSADDAWSGAPEDGDAGAGDDAATADRLIEIGAADSDQPLDVDYLAETFHHDSSADSMEAGFALGSSASGSGIPDGGGSGDGPDLDRLAGPSIGLYDHLVAQAGMALAGDELLIALEIIGQIDDAGYLTATVSDLAGATGAAEEDVERVLQLVQRFDPSGVGARSLAECLAIQAREADRYDPCMAKLIANLDLVARGAISQLRRLCEVDEEDIADMISELRRYDPKPGLRFFQEAAVPVTPDIFVRRTATGWAVELNSATLPRVLVNRGYYAEVSRTSDRKARAWLSECLSTANWLVKALDQRTRTIIRVATEIVRQQEAFFAHGVQHLRPLTLRAIADATEMHESTVSRATSNKYLSCERGTFELRYFFSSAVAATDGESVSATAIKSHIRALIAEEGDRILSDDRLVELLGERGFSLARRTVAKYREAIGLGSSIQRRRKRALEKGRT